MIDAGRPDQALALVQSALAVEPDDPDLLACAAWAVLDSKPQKAVEYAHALLRVAPHDSAGHVIAAHACSALDLVSQGVEHADHALAISPDGLSELVTVAYVVSRDSGGKTRAMAAAQRAIELYPDDPRGFVAAGVVEMHRGHFRRSRGWMQKALAIDPSNRAALLGTARADGATGQLASSFVNLQTRLSVDPTDSGARELLEETVGETLGELWTVLIVAVIFAHRGRNIVHSPVALIAFAFAAAALFSLARRPTVARHLPWSHVRHLVTHRWRLGLMAAACVLCFVGAITKFVASGTTASIGSIIGITGGALGSGVLLVGRVMAHRQLRGRRNG